MNYEAWVKVVPVEITGDSLWKMEAYRLALFAADVGWHDVTKLIVYAAEVWCSSPVTTDEVSSLLQTVPMP